jgi:hypothetical protein
MHLLRKYFSPHFIFIYNTCAEYMTVIFPFRFWLTPKLNGFLWRSAPTPCSPAMVKSLDSPNEAACVFFNPWHLKVLAHLIQKNRLT